MNVNDIRVMTRTQLDLDDTDLPDALLDNFMRDGYYHVINMERRWPFFTSQWTISVDPAVATPLPADVAELDMVIGPSGRPLPRVDWRWAAERFNSVSPTTGDPAYWMVRGPELHMLPPAHSVYDVQAIGYRLPIDWVSLGASGEVDADVRLHLPIVWYCCSVGYAQQEDEVLEATYMNRFKEAAGLGHAAVMRPWTGQPRQFAYTPFTQVRIGARQPKLVFQLPPGP